MAANWLKGSGSLTTAEGMGKGGIGGFEREVGGRMERLRDGRHVEGERKSEG